MSKIPTKTPQASSISVATIILLLLALCGITSIIGWGVGMTKPSDEAYLDYLSKEGYTSIQLKGYNYLNVCPKGKYHRENFAAYNRLGYFTEGTVCSNILQPMETVIW